MRTRKPLAILTTLAVAAGCSSASSPTSSSTSSGGDGGSTAGSGGAQSSSGSGAASSTSGSSGAGGSAPTALIHFIGRFDTSDPKGPSFAWPASAIVTRFSGTGIDVKLHDSGNNQFAVVIDGAAPTLLKTSAAKDTYTLASGLPDAVHDLTLTKRTESFVGAVQFLGLTPAGGKPLIETSAPFKRKIEFIGDSITCGYGDEGANANCGFTPDTENETLAYGALTAKSLSAEHHAISYSGIGAYRDNSGSTANPMGLVFQRTFADVKGSTWDFSAWTPDVVVVNLATNDFAKGDPGQPFTDAYLALLKQVRGHYAQAFIVCALGPMLSDSYPAGAMALTKARGYITGAVSAMSNGGDKRVSFVEFPEQDAKNGLGCDYHPSLKTHQLMADKLQTAIKSVTGW